MSRLLLALALLVGADAFLVSPVPAPLRSPARSSTLCMGVEEAAADCLESGCSLDDVSVLIEELKGALPYRPRKEQVRRAHSSASQQDSVRARS